MRRLGIGLVLFAFMVAPSTFSLAHTSVTSTSPKTGAVLERSPPEIEIQFRSEARLTSVVVIEAGNSERKLEFAPKGSAASFKLANPELKPGRNEIQWKALSKDGHVVSGSLVITIDSKAN